MNFAQTGPVNRVAEALSLYAIQEAQSIAANPAGWKQDASGLDLKIRFYEGITAAAYPHPSKAERSTLRFVRHQIRRMSAIKYPTPLRQLIYHPVSIFLRDILLQRRQGFRQMETQIRHTMRNELRTLNHHAVQQSLNDRGFRLPVETILRKMMAQEMPQFHFRYADPARCKNTEFVLHFAKVPGSDFYYFQSFDAATRPDLQSMLNRPAGAVQQSFDLYAGKSFSAPEAAALVNGGFVAHIEEGHEKWYSLDTEGQHLPGQVPLIIHSFDLEAELKKLPLRPLSATQSTNLIRALREGQARSVELQIDGRGVRCKIQAAPQSRALAIYDEHGRRLAFASTPQKNSGAKASLENGLRVLSDIGNTPTVDKKKRKIGK
ncbi:hypothetical protein WJU16_22325 [Chitinophaga pollutisoli]|uniref:Uncharacterized protein n=1 Tax=Chitinophaga pollutisoli TaxID=3133966 RepID=A0ABZ2YMA1_9BACT|nr:hypothetical protein [Chitinophaga rhizosphaerae]